MDDVEGVVNEQQMQFLDSRKYFASQKFLFNIEYRQISQSISNFQ